MLGFNYHKRIFVYSRKLYKAFCARTNYLMKDDIFSVESCLSPTTAIDARHLYYLRHDMYFCTGISRLKPMPEYIKQPFESYIPVAYIVCN